MTNKEALELSLTTLERDNLMVGNICVNYEIQKALIKLVKKKLEKKKQKKKWVGLSEDDIVALWKATPPIVGLYTYTDIAREVETKLKEKNRE